jgi:hypothetical protein
LQKAYTIVSHKLIDMIGEQSSTTEPHGAVFIAATDTEGKSDGDKRNNSKERKRSSRGKQGASSTQEEGEAGSSPKADRRAEKPYMICGSTRHWTENCPELKEVVAAWMRV